MRNSKHANDTYARIYKISAPQEKLNGGAAATGSARPQGNAKSWFEVVNDTF